MIDEVDKSLPCETCKHTAYFHDRKGKHSCKLEDCDCNWFRFPQVEKLEEAPKAQSLEDILTETEKQYDTTLGIDPEDWFVNPNMVTTDKRHVFIQAPTDTSLTIEENYRNIAEGLGLSDDVIEKGVKALKNMGAHTPESDVLNLNLHPNPRFDSQIVNHYFNIENPVRDYAAEIYHQTKESLKHFQGEPSNKMSESKDNVETALNGEVRTVNDTTGAQKGMKPQRHDLIPGPALDLLATLYGNGAAKYAAHNWRRGYEWSKSYAAAQRHMLLFWEGEDIDPEMQVPHVICAAFHMFALATYMQEHPEMDDRFSTVLKREATEKDPSDINYDIIPSYKETEAIDEIAEIIWNNDTLSGINMSWESVKEIDSDPGQRDNFTEVLKYYEVVRSQAKAIYHRSK